MVIFPAIDLKGGQCVRLFQGRMEEATIYGDDPARMAQKWESQGAEWLHVVDLEGAVAGKYANLEAVRAITAAVSMSVQFGGGIRDMEALEMIFAAGVSRAVIGTAFIEDKDFAAQAIQNFGGRIAVGLDAKNGMVAVKGWLDVTAVSLIEAAQQAQALGAERLICTDISTDGAMTGPNLGSYTELVDDFDISIIASGGVSSLDDIRDLRVATDDRLEGVIIGRAIYEGAFTLVEAIEAGVKNVD